MRLLFHTYAAFYNKKERKKRKKKEFIYGGDNTTASMSLVCVYKRVIVGTCVITTDKRCDK